MMRMMKRFVQAGFIAGLLAAGSANAADAAKAVPTSVDTSGGICSTPRLESRW